jgi:RNA polymerase sigma factor (sigma-70 family)
LGRLQELPPGTWFIIPVSVLTGYAPCMGEVREALRRKESTSEVERTYREHGPRLWRSILALTGSADMTNDVVAEAFAQCLQRGPEVRSPSKWVWKAAFRIAAGQLKERGRQAELEDVLFDPPEAAVELMWALRQLAPRQRAVVVLRYYGGYRPVEIAEIIGIAAPTVRVHLMRGLRKLRELLGEGASD